MPTSFGSRLRWWRAYRGFSQLDLAGAAGTSQRHVSFLESGRAQVFKDWAAHSPREPDIAR